MYAALDGNPLFPIGVDLLMLGNLGYPTATNITLDAANEASICLGHVFTSDGQTHTLDTSGSSSIGWRAGAVTFANAGTTVKVGLATVDDTTGPASRATNVADVVTYSVSASLTGGGGGISANTWHEHVPDTGSLSVGHTDLLAMAVQMTARGGADSVIVTNSAIGNGAFHRPGVTQFVGGAYTAVASVPNCHITFADGATGWFAGSSLWSVASTGQTWNSGSATKEYGNFIQRPYPMRVHGIISYTNFTNNADLVLYSDPLGGSPVAERTIAIDANQTQTGNSRAGFYMLSNPYNVAPNQPLGVIMKPGASNISSIYKTFNAAVNGRSEIGGQNIYAINRASGAFAAQNSNKDKFAIGLLVEQFSGGVNPIYGLGI